MKIEKVQSNQTTFGTKVFLKSPVKDMMLKSKAKQKFMNHINKLENNGNDDIFVIRHLHDDNICETDFLIGTIFVKRKNGIYGLPFGTAAEFVIKNRYKKGDKHANLLELYRRTNSDILQWFDKRKISEDFFKTYLSTLETII